MNQTDSQKANTEEFSLKDILLNVQKWWKYILSKWLIILFAGVIGGVIGLACSYLKKPVYTANLSFTLQDEKAGGGGLSGALNLASQFGFDVGGSGGNEFSEDNVLQFMLSRLMVEKTLLTPVYVNGKTETLAEFYIQYNELRQKWSGKVSSANMSFLPGADRSKFTTTQDSVLGVLHKKIINESLTVDKVDKKLSFITITFNSTNELFAKLFTEVLAKSVSDFYIKTRTEKSYKNVAILQRQTDSVRRELNANLSGVASSVDANPNPNPSLQTLRVPSQRKQVDVQANTAILAELVKNLELAKMSLLQETPLIQVIDKPILPLDKEKLSKPKGIVIGAILSMFIAAVLLLFRKIFKAIISDN